MTTQSETSCKGLCNQTGLAVFPARYAVVPKDVGQGLPTWASDSEITSVNLDDSSQYGLRILRKGYLYLYYPQNNDWECYSISEQGSLWKQAMANNPAPVHDSKQNAYCKSPTHNAINTEFICIKDPKECGEIFLAYSQYKWSQETLDRYTLDTSLRKNRMQSFMPKNYMASGATSTGISADEKTLQHIIEYRDDIDDIASTLSSKKLTKAENLWGKKTPSWKFEETVLEERTSLYPWVTDRDSKSTLDRMQARSVDGDKKIKPLIFPLWDAIGIAHEIAGWCFDALGMLDKYGKERSLELNTQACLVNAQTLITNAKRDTLKQKRENNKQVNTSGAYIGKPNVFEPYPSMQKLDQGRVEKRRLDYLEKYQGQDAIIEQINQDSEILKNWVNELSSSASSKEISYVQELLYSDYSGSLDVHQQKIKNIEERYLKYKKELPLQSWDKYQSRLNTNTQNAFEAFHEDVENKIRNLCEINSYSLIAWVQAPVFIITLNDLSIKNQDEIDPSLCYQSAVGMCLAALNNSDKGAEKINEWWDSYNILDEGNLIWRHLAANRPDLIQELSPQLELIQQEHAQDEDAPILTFEEAMTFANSIREGLKNFVDFYGKALEAIDKPLADNTSSIEIALAKSDVWLASVGQKVAQTSRITEIGETKPTTAYRVWFVFRSGIKLKEATKVITSYFKDAPGMFGVLVNKQEIGVEKKIQQAWVKHLESPKNMSNFKQSKINSVLLVFNLMDSYALYRAYKKKGDEEALLKLRMSFAAIGATAAALTYQIMEGNIKSKAESNAALSIKGIGSSLTMVVSTYAVINDYNDIQTNIKKGNGWVVGVLGLKIASDTLIATQALGTMVGMLPHYLTDKVSGALLGLFEKQLMTPLGALRIFSIMITWQVQVVILIAYGLAVYFSDDELQEWCENCIFGLEPEQKTWEKEEEEFATAMNIVLPGSIPEQEKTGWLDKKVENDVTDNLNRSQSMINTQALINANW